MKLLILLEDEKYLPLVEEIKRNRLIEVEVNNIDFNITNPIKRAEVVLFLGDEQSYQYLKEEYRGLLTEKLIFTTATTDIKSDFEVEAYINCGVIVCNVPRLSEDICAVIIEIAKNIFDGRLKTLISNEQTYKDNINQVIQLETELNNLANRSLEFLPENIIQQIFTNFEIKNH